MTRITGTREWSDHSENIIRGCSHDCKYCYARHNAISRHKIVEEGNWTKEEILTKKVEKKRYKKKGVTMFPTSHDITPKILDACTTVLKKLLKAGNEVLIVSKPHLECIQSLCRDLEPWKEQILFRFSIGSTENATLMYWEPNAPKFEERLESLKYAYGSGYRTSVSCEPLLTDKPVELVEAVSPYVTDTIWIGKLNHIRKRVPIENGFDEVMVRIVEEFQTDEQVLKNYITLKDNPLIKWKDSYQEVLENKTTLKDLLDRHIDKVLVDVVMELYPKQKPEGYYHMLKTLRTLEPKEDEELLVLKIRHVTKKWEQFEDDEYESVIGWKPSTPDETWALEYSDWAQWLGWRIDRQTLENYTELQIIAHCLWEMTWIGFDQERINETVKELNRRVESIKDGTAKLIPWEEAKEDLKEKIKSRKERKENEE